MLQNFTWQQFLVAALVFSLLWYGGIWFFWLRHRKLGGLGWKGSSAGIGSGRSGRSAGKLPHRWEGDVEVLSPADELMGKSRLPEGMELLSGSELRFAGKEGTADRSDQLGLVPDLLQELKLLFQRLAEEDGKKSDFFRLLEALKSGFPKMGGHPQMHALNEFIIDHAPFHLTPGEIADLWD